MTSRSILYFEKVIPEYKQVLEENVPAGFTMLYWNEMNSSEQESALQTAEYFLIVGEFVTADMIAKAKNLRLIQRTGVGYNNVDVAAADQHGVSVAILPGGNGIAVAEHALLLILALQRHLIEVNADTKAGQWPLWKYRTTSYELDGKTHGFLGFGFIGRATAARSKAFGTRIVYNDLFRPSEAVEQELGAVYMSKEDVLKNSDIVSIHIPLTAENKNYIGAAELALMRKNALLINVSRGGLVDEAALFDALQSGQLFGAGIDTFEKEPCPADNPLFTLPNVIATSHVAAGTLDTFKKQAAGSFDNIVLAEQTGSPDFTVGNIKTIRA